MAKILILGGGFGGVIAAEHLAKRLSDEHQITLISRSKNFVFYPALVRLAFGKCDPKDVSFDLRDAMLRRRVNFVEAEVAHFDPLQKEITIAHGEVHGRVPYDYLIFALGRRLAIERISGFFEHAHHLLNVDKAIKFGKAISDFHEGHAVIGLCEGARLPVPVYETAFALARRLEERGERERVKITVVTPAGPDSELGEQAGAALTKALAAHQIELLPDFPIETITRNRVFTKHGDKLDFNLLMLLPPFRGSSAANYTGSTDCLNYLLVDRAMRVVGHKGLYAVGDCVNFDGPKMGHMAVRQGEVAAANLLAEIEGREPLARYSHELKLIIEEPGANSIYLQKEIWTDEPGIVREGRFWSWAKRAQQKYWQFSHS